MLLLSGDWVEKYQLQQPKKLLTTFAEDVEVKFVSGGAGEVVEYTYDSSRRGGGVCREHHDLHCLGLETDAEKGGFPHRAFDLVVVSNTLEHMYNPLLVLSNILAVMVRDDRREDRRVFLLFPSEVLM